MKSIWAARGKESKATRTDYTEEAGDAKNNWDIKTLYEGLAGKENAYIHTHLRYLTKPEAL